MQVLAGEEDFDVSVKECGCTFTFNFRDVYWNSRCDLHDLGWSALYLHLLIVVYLSQALH